jgi:hypothetical protein
VKAAEFEAELALVKTVITELEDQERAVRDEMLVFLTLDL